MSRKNHNARTRMDAERREAAKDRRRTRLVARKANRAFRAA
jgi:hypothetical protein